MPTQILCTLRWAQTWLQRFTSKGQCMVSFFISTDARDTKRFCEPISKEHGRMWDISGQNLHLNRFWIWRCAFLIQCCSMLFSILTPLPLVRCLWHFRLPHRQCLSPNTTQQREVLVLHWSLESLVACLLRPELDCDDFSPRVAGLACDRRCQGAEYHLFSHYWKKSCQNIYMDQYFYFLGWIELHVPDMDRFLS